MTGEWRLCGWGFDTTVQTWQPAIEDTHGDLATVKWTQPYILCSWGGEITVDTKWLGSEDNTADSATGEWE